MTVREARIEDVVPLSDALEPEVSRRQIAMRLQEHFEGHRVLWVPDLDGQPVATVSHGGPRHKLPGSLRLFALDVGKDYRRRGIGAALVRAVEEEARRQGLSTVNLEVAQANTDASRLYKRLGYRSSGAPIVERWERAGENGALEPVREVMWVMVKRLD